MKDDLKEFGRLTGESLRRCKATLPLERSLIRVIPLFDQLRHITLVVLINQLGFLP